MGKRDLIMAVIVALGGLAVCLLPVSARAIAGGSSATAQITDQINDNDVVTGTGQRPSRGYGAQ